MKKIIFFVLVSFATVSLHAQLSKTKWKGTLQLDNPVDVLFDFGQDSLTVYVVENNSGLETMLFTVKDSVLSIKKVYGQSDCDDQITGKYKYEIKNDEMLLTLVSDDCVSRATVLDKTRWMRFK
ncbi:MAG TPA: hypothetical protein VK543_01465 [Puia sp.]|nr:hypothetical protein [Puia sp.]